MKIVDPREQQVGICAACKKPITHPGPDGECMRCLVSFGFLAEDHEAGVTRDRPGPLRYAHFEVEIDDNGFPVVLGAGAMAVTYRARDTILNSTVALKVIGRKLAENPTARARFLREARAAAKIHHPNVARVSHYGEEDGECFYAMELVEGETLEARVQRDGPLALPLALEVIQQTARGLAAAEVCGVVHRDIKPSNLMIESAASGEPLVKIIDYGVAKIMASDATAQTQAGFIGTPAFASPEQFDEAGHQQIDARSDIYSLGATLWYLLTGHTPFAGRTIEEIRAKQTGALPLQQLKRAHVPLPVISLLNSMLAVDTAKRPQSARELLGAVHRCYVRFEPRARMRRKRLVLATAASMLIILGIAFLMLLYQRARSAAEVERSIAVLPFENLSPGNGSTFFTVGMQEEITANLARLADIKVIGAQSTHSYSPDKSRDLPAIARELGVTHLLEGSVWRDNGQVRLSLWLVNTRDPNHPWIETYERPVSDVFAMQSEITRAVAARLHAKFSGPEKTEVDQSPTKNLAAYDLYLRAREGRTLWENEADVRRDSERKIALLNEAVKLDPSFALAYCELAKAHGRISFYKAGATAEELSVDHRSLAEVALQKARRLQPDLGELHLAQAFHFLYVTKDLDQARIETELARRTLPNNAEVEDIAGLVARRQGRWDEAIRCLERAVTLDPRAKRYPYTLAETYRLLRRYEDFDRTMDRVIAMPTTVKPGTLTVERAVGDFEGRGDIGSLHAAVAAASAANNLDEEDLDLYGLLLPLWRRDLDGLFRYLTAMHADGVAIAGVHYPKSWFEAVAARMFGDTSKAESAFAAARVQAASAVLADSTSNRKLGLLAMIDAGLGRRDEAVEEARRAYDLASNVAIDAPVAACNLAIVYAWTGQSDLALAVLEEWISRPAGANQPDQPTYGDFKLNPVWDPLRSDARFQALVQRLSPSTSKH
jgi:serine/threonine protein kinase/tetratricopeptide (TPR) repeat protein